MFPSGCFRAFLCIRVPGMAGCLSGTLRLKTLLLADQVVGQGGHLQAPCPYPPTALSLSCNLEDFMKIFVQYLRKLILAENGVTH